MEKKIVLLRGNSGSGKSTVAKMLQKALGANIMLISQDTVRREILHVKDTPENPACELMKTLVEYGVFHCDTVILEGILYSDYYGSLFETVIKTYGENIFAYYFDIPFEETLLRHNTRPQSAEFGPESMKKWWREKDYLSVIPEKRLTKELSANDILSLILSDLSAGGGK